MIAMTACMDALAAGGKWSEAIKILDEMRSKGVTPNERTYKVCVSPLSRGHPCTNSSQSVVVQVRYWCGHTDVWLHDAGVQQWEHPCVQQSLTLPSSRLLFV